MHALIAVHGDDYSNGKIDIDNSHQCRSRHLKCDGQQPCMHCRRAARDCSKDDNHIFLNESNIGIVRRRRRYSLSFEDDQKWMNLPASVRFADTVESPSSGVPSSGITTPAHHNGSVDSLQSCSPTQTSYHSDPENQSCFPLDPALNISTDVLQPFRDFIISNNPPPSSDPDGSNGLHSVVTGGLNDGANQDQGQTNESAPASLWPYKAQWPFTTYQEALLMRHYVTDVAPLWDVVDGGTHFSTTVPELAATSPALLRAIFAISAKCLSLTGKLDESICLRYTDAAYQVLLPDLQAKAYEGENLAAVLLLCQVIALSSDMPSEESKFKLGLDIFLSAWQANPTSSFHAQLFFSVLRMHFHQSFYTRETLVEVQGDCEWMWPALDAFAGSSRQWAAHIKIHSARCLNYVCDTNKSWEDWMSLKQFSDIWRMTKPGYFDPVFQQDPNEGDPFPTRLFASALYAGTHQYFSLARLLLLNNQPQTEPPPELDILPISRREIEQESRLILRKVLGAVISHMDSIPVILSSTMPIVYCGHLLTDMLTQEYAYNILEMAHKTAPRVVPSKEILRLRRVWGWDEEVIYQNVGIDDVYISEQC